MRRLLLLTVVLLLTGLWLCRTPLPPAPAAIAARGGVRIDDASGRVATYRLRDGGYAQVAEVAVPHGEGIAHAAKVTDTGGATTCTSVEEGSPPVTGTTWTNYTNAYFGDDGTTTSVSLAKGTNTRLLKCVNFGFS